MNKDYMHWNSKKKQTKLNINRGKASGRCIAIQLGILLTLGNEMTREIDEKITSVWKRLKQYIIFLRNQRNRDLVLPSTRETNWSLLKESRYSNAGHHNES